MEEAQRPSGALFLRLSSSAPSWASAAIHEAHCGELPNDSRYQLIRDALSSLAEGSFSSEEDALEALPELSADLLPCLTSSLLGWFAASPSRLASCDQAIEEGRLSEGGFSSFDLLSEGWRICAEDSLSSLISSLEEERSSLFNPDTDSQLLLSDSHGIYIPKLWAEEIEDAEEASWFSVKWEDVEACQAGPDHPLYWEAWDAILSDALWDENGEDWRLLQNGDLWAVKAEAEIPEAWLF